MLYDLNARYAARGTGDAQGYPRYVRRVTSSHSLRVIALSLRSRKRNLTPRETIHFPSTALSPSAPALGQISHDGLALAFKTNCRESTSSLTLNEPKDRKLWSARESDGNDVAHLERQLISLCTRPVAKIIGPAFIGYGPTGTLDLSDARFARPFSSHAAFGELQAVCQPEEWDHGGREPHLDRTFGVVDPANQLLALAGYEAWNDSIAHISIVTDPRQRGRGLGRAAVALAAQHALGAGLLPQYRTLSQNTPSMNIAKRLGFIEYGFSVYVRLQAG